MPPGDPATSSDKDWIQQGYRYAYALTHHQQNAEDLVQDAWLKLCRAKGRPDAVSHLLITIRHLYIDQCRRKRVVDFELLDPETTAADIKESALPDAIDLEPLLSSLRPVEREAVYLHYVAGHSAEEIGTLTKRPRGTVLSLMHRSLAKLRALAVRQPTAKP